MARPDSGKGEKRPSRGGAGEVRRRMRALADPKQGEILQRFFKTGPGEYGEGDRFLGLRVPQVRSLVREYRALGLGEVRRLLQSPFHEERLFALLVLVERYRREEGKRGEIYRLYLDSTDRINNWDLVDVTAEHIVGAHLAERSRAPLTGLARSPLLWERRIAVIATFHFIRRDEFNDTLLLARILIGDSEDLIHKAVGWLLREVGKRDRPRLESFLREEAAVMPRTMLRYATEKFPEGLRRRYLRMKGEQTPSRAAETGGNLQGA